MWVSSDFSQSADSFVAKLQKDDALVSEKRMQQCMWNAGRWAADVPHSHHLQPCVQLGKHNWNVLLRWKKEGWASPGGEDLRKANPSTHPPHRRYLAQASERHRFVFAKVCSAFCILVFKVWGENRALFNKDRSPGLPSQPLRRIWHTPTQ